MRDTTATASAFGRISTVSEMSFRAATCRLCAVAVFLTIAGCGVPDRPRWERGEVVATSVGVGEPDADGAAFAIVDVGPVVAAIEARGEEVTVDFEVTSVSESLRRAADAPGGSGETRLVSLADGRLVADGSARGAVAS